MCGVGFLVGLMTGCVAPLYHCNTSYGDHGKKEDESAQVRIKIRSAHQCQLSRDTSSRRRNSIDSNDAKIIKQVVQEAKPVSLEEAQIVPVTPSLNRRRIPGKIWSSALRNQLEDMTHAFSDTYDGSTKVVQAQIEVHPRIYSATSDETLDSTKYKSLAPVFDDPVPDNNNDCSNNERTKKLPLIRKTVKKFRKRFTCSSSEKSMVLKGFATDKSRRSNLASPVSGLRVPAAQSTMLQRSGQVSRSPSTRISETRPQGDGGVSAKQNDSNEYAESRKESREQSSRAGASREMVSLINRQSVNGKSMCDVTINGLTMNQSDLLDLFEATEGKARSVSMTTTEEAQIISIKFYRRKNDNKTAQNEDSQKQSGVPNLMIPPIYVSDYSENDTSYRGFPKMKKNGSNCPVRRGTRRNTFWKAKVT